MVTAANGAIERMRFYSRRLSGVPALALWLLFGTGPAIIIMAGFIFSGENVDPDALPGLRRLGLLMNSAFLAAGVSVFCTALSLLAVSGLQRFAGGRFGWLVWLPLILIAIPPFIHASAWMEAGRLFNLACSTLGLPVFSTPGWFSVLWVQSMSFIPVTFGFCMAGMNRAEHMLIDAGRISAGDWRVLRKIRLPLAFPVIMVGSGLVALLSLSDFSTPALFQLRSYAMEIFVTYSSGADEKTAFLLALPMLALSLIIIMFLLRGIRHTASLPGGAAHPSYVPSSYPAWFRSLQGFTFLVLVLQIAVPLVMLFSQTVSLPAFAGAVLAARQEIGSSLITALAAAAGSVCLGLFLFARLRRMGWLLLCLLPLAFPATLTGIGLIKLWNHPQTALIYGGFMMPVLASIARYSPICILVLHYYDNAIAGELPDAARLFRGNGPSRWLRIMLPLYAPGLIAGFLIVFALALGELPATLMIVPPGQGTISIRIFNLLHYGGSQSVASLSLFIMGLSMAAASLFLLTISRWKTS